MPVVGLGSSAGTSDLALGVVVAPDPERQRGAGVGAVDADLEEGQVERVEDQLDLAADQLRVDLVAVAVQGDRAGLGDRAVLGPAESLHQIGRVFPAVVAVLCLRRSPSGGRPPPGNGRR